MAKKAVTKKANTNRMVMISARAKDIRAKKPKLEWTKCIKQASAELKKEGKL